MQKGLFSFIIIFVMLLIILELNIFFQKNNNDFEKTKNELIKLEIANCERTIMEENIDKIIFLTLKKESKTITNNSTVKNNINTKLFNYLKDKARATNLFVEEKNNLTLNFLNNNSVVTIIKIKELILAEYVFASNETKTNIISAEIGNKLKTEFRIPIDYLVRIEQ